MHSFIKQQAVLGDQIVSFYKNCIAYVVVLVCSILDMIL